MRDAFGGIGEREGEGERREKGAPAATTETITTKTITTARTQKFCDSFFFPALTEKAIILSNMLEFP